MGWSSRQQRAKCEVRGVWLVLLFFALRIMCQRLVRMRVSGEDAAQASRRREQPHVFVDAPLVFLHFLFFLLPFPRPRCSSLFPLCLPSPFPSSFPSLPFPVPLPFFFNLLSAMVLSFVWGFASPLEDRVPDTCRAQKEDQLHPPALGSHLSD